MQNCKLGNACTCTPAQRPTCTNWTPSRGSKYYNCARFTAARITCDEPRSACQLCPHYEGEAEGDLGRPNMSGRDWDDPDERRRYMQEYMQKRRHKKKRSKGTDGPSSS